MRFAAYAGTSTVLATAVVVRAFHQRANFYSACVYLSQSNACLMILTNLILLCVCLSMLSLQRLLYGPLRPIEIEQLYEKAWFAITETCLAMTIFREEVGAWFLVMFVGLLVGKVWGWIGEGRVEVLEQQPPANPRLFHARLSFSLFISLAFDIAVLHYSVQTVLQQARPNMMVMFAFEFAVLSIASSSTAARYSISLIEAYIIKRQTIAKVEERRTQLRAARAETSDSSATPDTASDGDQNPRAAAHAEEDEEIDEADIDVPGWEEKGRWVFYLELATDFMKLVVYLSFFFILLTFYGLPIHIMRDVFLTIRSFVKRINDFVRYRRATRDMNERYPDASAEEVAREEVCIICREEMRVQSADARAPQDPGRAAVGHPPARQTPPHVEERSRPKRLPCGHILHFGCLRSWLERQQICPTCRRPVMATNRLSIGPADRVPGFPNNNLRPERPANGPQIPNVDQNNRHPGAQPQGHGRVFNLGPFRFGFGVAPANAHPNPAVPGQGQHGGPQLAGGAEGQQNHVAGRQVTFGFGIGQAARAVNPPSVSQGRDLSNSTIQAQITQLEQRINREINHLRVSAEQLRLIRGLQHELSRIRLMRAGPHGTNLENAMDPEEVRPTASPLQIHVADPQTTPAGGGQSQLPPNMVLPPGWTLMPLRRLHPNNGHQQTTEPFQAASQTEPAPASTLTPRESSNVSHRQVVHGQPDTRLPSSSYVSMDSSGPLQEGAHDAGHANRAHSSTQNIESAAPNRFRLPSDFLPAGGPGADTPSGNTSTEQDAPPLPIPAWGAKTADHKSHTPAMRVQDTEQASGTVAAPDLGVPSSADSEESRTKGKGKAVTIEDQPDDGTNDP
ncbi:MAG: E3 ubiquitin-protein ligase hrd1 [Caeruleum heppii]|nr:MAG: E3 ubiquitin-protein ligase hrd1 [Caeruleum heppii]